MAIAATCPSCKRALHVPEGLAGRRVSCPRCGHPLRVPLPLSFEAAAAPSPGSVRPQADGAAPLSARLGIAALALGLCSVLVLCVPLVGYASPGLSGLGLLLGFSGLLRARWECRKVVAPPLVGRAEWPYVFRGDLPDYPLAGTAACLLALALALLPVLLR
jgi:hypothetical protein